MSDGPLRVVVAGATGRLGRLIADAVDAAPDLVLAGRAAPSLGLSLEAALARGGVDAVLDVSLPVAVAGHARRCADAGVDAVIGTSGWGDGDRAGADAAARASGARLLWCPNFSVGAVLAMRLAAEALAVLGPLGGRAEIVELHHEGKVDAPSGTAGQTAARMGGDVPIHSVRLPGLVAHQEVLVGAPGELLTIRHDAFDRQAYLPGALLALRRVATLPPGLTVGLEHVLDAEV